MKKKQKKFLKKAKKLGVKKISPEKVLNTFHGSPLVREGRVGYFTEDYDEGDWI